MRALPARAVPLRVLVSGGELLTEALSVRPEVAHVSRAEGSLDVAARLTRADVLIVDASAAPAFAYEAIRALTVETPVLALTESDQALTAIAAGASGALHQDSPPDLILAAATALFEGLAVFDQSFLSQLVPSSAKGPAAADAYDSLTAREQQVLTLLAEGLSNKEIAARLDISDHTAKFHVNSILQKMGAQKRVEAVVRAARLGILDL